MKTKYEKIIKQLENNNNVLLYKQDLYTTYKNIKTIGNIVYISTPKKGKSAYQEIIKKIDKNTNTKNKTISQLLEQIIEKTQKEKLYICIDNFHQLTKRELDNYKQLIENKNIHFVANINEDQEFIDQKLLDNFIILDKEYLSNRSQSININYVLLLLISFLIFLLFIRIQLSNTRFIVSGLWFTLLMYRSIYYISK